MEDEVCRRLAWDSEFFGVRIARLLPQRLTPETVGRADEWCSAEKIDCLYFLADSDDARTVSIAEDCHFRLVDVRVTLVRPVPRGESGQPMPQRRCVRPFRPEDVPILRGVARTGHRDSRFYADPNFPDGSCDSLYETWIEKSCEGYADAVFVADLGSGPAGYATAHRADRGEGRIGLIAVEAQSQGQGLGGELIAAVLDWCGREGLRSLGVVTQGRNVRAQRLYVRNGFVPQSVQIWYHRWFR